MRIEFLGTAGAVGLPRPTCACRICAEARARGVPYSRNGPALFVHGPDLLIDTPEDIVQSLNRANIPLAPTAVQPPADTQPSGRDTERDPTPTPRPFEITVYDAKTRKPLPKTTVQLTHRPARGMLSGVAVRRTTDLRGGVQLDLPVGVYDVSASRSGYLPWNQQMTY